MSSEVPDHHANLDVAGRRVKAEKIIALLGRRRDFAGTRILDIGTGSGVIADQFSRAATPGGHVDSVDVLDLRIVRDSYTFHLIDGTTLPFADDSFDIVVSNHVVEHIGTREQQQRHFSEIARTLRPDGIAYFASPNRLGLVEPHYRLPLLGALRKPWQDKYVQIARHAPEYDCRLLTRTDFRHLTDAAGLVIEDSTGEAMQVVGRTEATNPLARLITRAPAGALRYLRALSPTMVAILRPSASAGADSPPAT